MWGEWLCVGLATGLIGWIYSTTLWLLRPTGWLYLGCLSASALLAWWSYWACVFTPPGYNEQDQGNLDYATWCDKCGWYRPERSHHCRQCGRCVLRMDHHCPWIAGCVGYFNHGHFIRFIFYAWLGCALSLGGLLATLWAAIRDDRIGEYLWGFLLVFDTALTFFLSLVLGIMLVMTSWSISLNRTTIEEEEYRQCPGKYPFDLGLVENWRSFLGSRLLPLPLPAHLAGLGNGLSYPRTNSTLWPPEHENEDEDDNDAKMRIDGELVVPGGLIQSQMADGEIKEGI